jgi:DNA-binding HxlR family transcriptional regulator
MMAGNRVVGTSGSAVLACTPSAAAKILPARRVGARRLCRGPGRVASAGWSTSAGRVVTAYARRTYTLKMVDDDLPGPVEAAVLDALHRGALGVRCSARAIPGLRDEPAGEQLLHEILNRCEERGLVRTERHPDRREWRLTPAGRTRLRTRQRFARALASVMARTG